MATTFNRYEKKYMIKKSLKDTILKELQEHIKQDDHQTSSYYTICNIYYDTIDDEIIKRSISKPVFKEKLRLRSYLQEGQSSLLFLEIKKKVNGFVNKRRTLITQEEANMLIMKKVMPIRKEYHNLQVLNEIYYYVRDKELIPKISISYDREAYFSIENPDFRLTFDDNITSRRDHVNLGRTNTDQEILEDYVLMELKTSTSIPLWMTQVLSKYQLYGNSFSKYGTEFYNYLINNRKDDEKCLNPYLTSQAHL